MTTTVSTPVVATGLLADRGELRSFRVPETGTHRRWEGAVERRYWSGMSWQLGTAAYWEQIVADADRPPSYRLGDDLLEELGACLLGGYGVPAHTAAAAFTRLRDAGVFRGSPRWTAARIERLLTEPFTEFAAPRRYRFPHQRSVRLAAAISSVTSSTPPRDPVTLRDWLLQVPGVGPKTASWIVRNQTSSDQVAIIDVHVIRAGTAAGLFDARWKVDRHYPQFEGAFLAWAGHAGIPASLLDACVWGVLAHAGPDARDILGTPNLSTLPNPVWPVDV